MAGMGGCRGGSAEGYCETLRGGAGMLCVRVSRTEANVRVWGNGTDRELAALVAVLWLTG